ncbi:MAG TPA: trigger factor, partial [Bacteroidales bacterium]|nr:trigger factor [Bacteroidales bacterium]
REVYSPVAKVPSSARSKEEGTRSLSAYWWKSLHPHEVRKMGREVYSPVAKVPSSARSKYCIDIKDRLTMNITHEKIDELSSVLKIEVSAADYQPQLEKTIKDYQKKMNMPGFRPGKVPASVVKKMYGKSMLVEEINKLVIDKMYEYLGQNNIDILGNPLPSKEKSKEIDWDNQTDFEFYFDFAPNPSFEIEPLENVSVKYYDITVDDNVVEKYLMDIRRRFGKFSNPETAESNDLVYAEFEELDAKGNILENGIKSKASVAIDMIKDKKEQKKFIGLKKDDTLDVDLLKIFENHHEISHVLNISHEKADEIKNKFRLKVITISRNDPAELNAELFGKVYKQDNITSEEQLKERIKTDAETSFKNESDNRFVSDTVEYFLKNTKITLPDAFLKRWLLETNKEKFTEEQVEKEYAVYADTLRWQLIENSLLKNNNIEVTPIDVKNYIKDYFKKNIQQGEETEESNQKLDSIVDRFMQNREETKKIYDQLYDIKLKDLFKGKIKIKNQKISYEDFVKLASEKHNHEHHDHEHEH